MLAIAAMSENRVIGRDGAIPWRLPADMRFFRRMTTGHVVVMGRKTFDSIGRPLPNRENVVISRREVVHEGIVRAGSPDEIVERADGRLTFVIGGSEIYRALMPRCSELLMTHVRGEFEGDAFFPPFEHEFVAAETLESDAEMKIIRYVRP